MIDWRVPIFISSCSGTGTVTVRPSTSFCMATWLPRCRAVENPCCSKSRMSSLPEKTFSLPNRDLDARHEYLIVKARLDFGLIGRFEE